MNNSSFALILLLIAGVVVLFLWKTLKEYLSTDDNLKRFKQETLSKLQIQAEPTPEEKLAVSEYGILSGILGYVANADGGICELEREMASSLIKDMAKDTRGFGSEEEVYEMLMKNFASSNQDIQSLTQGFVNLTKGEYKKKIKVVEFCFALGYADGELNEPTKEAIIDVGALLELSNEDFNELYDNFEKSYKVTITQEEAREMFGDYSDLYTRYQELLTQEKQNILDERNLNKPFTPDMLLRLRKIQKAYELLKS